MSTIPPNWLGSIIQTSGAQSRATEAKNTENAEQARRTAGGNFAEKLQDVIENSDRDAAVYEDAEGAGSQGRPTEGEEEEPVDGLDEDEDENENEDDPEAPETGGLDVEA